MQSYFNRKTTFLFKTAVVRFTFKKCSFYYNLHLCSILFCSLFFPQRLGEIGGLILLLHTFLQKRTSLLYLYVYLTPCVIFVENSLMFRISLIFPHGLSIFFQYFFVYKNIFIYICHVFKFLFNLIFIIMSYCGKCRYFNDWSHTYVEKSFPYVQACCSFWHIGYASRNTARRQKKCFVPKLSFVQLTFNF